MERSNQLIKIEISVYFHVELLVSPVCIATQRIISNWRKYQCLEYLSKMEMILINSQGHCKMLRMYMNIDKHACWNFCCKLSMEFLSVVYVRKYLVTTLSWKDMWTCLIWEKNALIHFQFYTAIHIYKPPATLFRATLYFKNTLYSVVPGFAVPYKLGSFR